MIFDNNNSKGYYLKTLDLITPAELQISHWYAFIPAFFALEVDGSKCVLSLIFSAP